MAIFAETELRTIGTGLTPDQLVLVARGLTAEQIVEIAAEIARQLPKPLPPDRHARR